LKKTTRSLICASLFVIAANGIATAGITATLMGVNNQAAAGVHLSPYDVDLQLGAGAGTVVPVVCDDFNTVTNLGQTWDAHIFSLENISDLKFASDPGGLDPSDTTKEYEAAMSLTQKLLQYPTDAPIIADYSFAIWGIFSAEARSSPGWTANALSLATVALGGTYNLSNFIGWEVVTPDPLSSAQEYLGYIPGALEPRTFLMMGLVLIFFGLFRKRFKLPVD